MHVSVVLLFLVAAIPACQGQTATELDITCAVTADCTSGGGGANADCTANALICQCVTAFYDNNGATAGGVCTAALALNGDCSAITDSTIASAACAATNPYSTCVSGTCQCSVTATYDTTTAAGGTCATAYGSACTQTSECTARLSGLICTNLLCVCSNGSSELDCSSGASGVVASFWALIAVGVFALHRMLG